MNEKRAVLVVGAGDATGGAIARRFACEGFIVCVTRRHADKVAPLLARIEADGGIAHGFGSDARDEAAVVELCARIERDIAPIDVAVFNVGGNVRFGIAERFPDRYALKDRDGILDPEAIADAYWQLHSQHRSAWTLELDLRPWMERW